MAQGEGFKHITVTAADEEDVVIRVGGAGKEADTAEDATSVGALSEHPSTEEADPAEGTGPVGALPERPSSEAANRSRKAPAKKKRDDYRETTLEDLEPQPMPLAQRVTIIAAVVCIIGAIIYCIAFLG